MHWQALLENSFSKFEHSSNKSRILLYTGLAFLILAVLCLVGLGVTAITANSDSPDYSICWIIGALLSFLIGNIYKYLGDKAFFSSLADLSADLDEVTKAMDEELREIC